MKVSQRYLVIVQTVIIIITLTLTLAVGLLINKVR